jgi:dihydroorotate dehydrogenase electron transfer subunit
LQTAYSLLYLRQMLDRKVKIKSAKNLGSGNYLLSLGAPEQARLAQPGQFVMLKCGDIEDLPLLRRPFSIFDTHPSPATGKPGGLDLLIKDVGSGTHKLAGLKAGDEVFVLGPQGHPFSAGPEMKLKIRSACLVAGGVGIAAMYLLARKLQSLEIRPILFYGGRSETDLVLRDYFEKLGIEIRCATEDGSLGERGFVTAPLATHLKSGAAAATRIYTCGPWGMMKAVHELAAAHKVHCEVSLEARMGCSLGACMGCVVATSGDGADPQYIRVCIEGPVINSSRVDWKTVPF